MSTTASEPTSSAPASSAITIQSMVTPPAATPAPTTPAPSPEARAPRSPQTTPATPPASPAAASPDHGTEPISTAPSFDDIVSLLMERDAAPVETPATGIPAPPADPAPDVDTDDLDPAEPAAAADADARDSGDDADSDAPDLEQKTPDAEAEEIEPDGEPLPEKFQKRIDGLVAMREKFQTQRDELRAQVDELEAKLAEHTGLPPVVLPATPDNPLADLTKEKDIQARITAAQQVIAWADAHPEGGEIQGDDGTEHYFSAEQVAQRKLRAERLLQIDAPKQLEFVRAHRAATDQAREVYPELFQPGTFLSTQADAFIANNPGILRNPNWPLLAADWVLGAGVRHGYFKLVPVAAAASPGKSPAATRPASPSAAVPAPSPAPAPVSAPAASLPAQTTAPRRTRQGTADQAMETYAQTGSTDDLAAYLERTAA